MINIKNELSQFQDSLKLCSLFNEAGAEVRFIGGAVRDIIAGLPVTDIDLATNLLPHKVEELLKVNHIHYFSIGKIFGTITAVINQHKIEITTLRKDINCDGRHAQVVFSNDWQEDALRRDFTINALSCDQDGNIYDYFGGLEDLRQGRVRFIGNPEDRIVEDYLRILRFFRFSAYFAKQIDEQSLSACAKYAHKLSEIAVSRFRAEMAKIFMASNGLKMLKIMQEQQILPCDSNSIIYLNNLYALREIFTVSELSYFGALLRGFASREAIISNSAFSRHESSLLKILVDSDINDFSYLNLKKLWQKYKNNFAQVILVNLAVHYDNVSDEVIDGLKKLFSLEHKALPLKGKDLLELGNTPGKEIGNLLAIAEDIWYNEEFNISKEELVKALTSSRSAVRA